MTYWNWTSGEVITQKKLQLLVKHCVWTFNDESERDIAIPPTQVFEGALVYVFTKHRFQYYDETGQWRDIIPLDPSSPIDVPSDVTLQDLLGYLVQAGVINLT